MIIIMNGKKLQKEGCGELELRSKWKMKREFKQFIEAAAFVAC